MTSTEPGTYLNPRNQHAGGMGEISKKKKCFLLFLSQAFFGTFRKKLKQKKLKPPKKLKPKFSQKLKVPEVLY